MYSLLQDLLQPAVLLQLAIGLTLLYFFVRKVAPRRRLLILIVLFLVQMILSTAAAGYLLEALMAGVAQGDPAAKVRLSAFLEGRAAKVQHR